MTLLGRTQLCKALDIFTAVSKAKERYEKTRPLHNLSKFHFFNFHCQRMNPRRQSKEYQAVGVRTLNQLQYCYFKEISGTWCDKMNLRLGFWKLIFESKNKSKTYFGGLENLFISSREITMVYSSPILVSVLACKWGEAWIIWSLLLSNIQQIYLFLFLLTFFSEGKMTFSFSFLCPFPPIT